MSRIDDNKKRIIHTGLYSKVAKEIIDSVIGNLSDGKWENSPSMEKYWRFVECKQATDGEVVLEISTESWKFIYIGNCKSNGFYSMSDDKIKQKFAAWIKCLAKDEMRDKQVSNMWDRESKMLLNYLSYHENVIVADAYFVYEKLLGRDNCDKYDYSTVLKVSGKKLSKEKELQIAEKLAHRDQLLKQLKDKKEADITQIKDKYNEDYWKIVNQYQKWIDDIKAA